METTIDINEARRQIAKILLKQLEMLQEESKSASIEQKTTLSEAMAKLIEANRTFWY